MGKFSSPFLRAGPYSLHNNNELDFDELITCLLYLLDNFCEGGSGWRYLNMKTIAIEVVEYRPISPKSHIELPNFINEKKAVINIKNTDSH